MVDELILQDMNVTPEEIEAEVAAAMSDAEVDDIDKAIDESIKNFEAGSIIRGRVINVIGDDVIVDVGYKSEGVVGLGEFDDPSSVTPGFASWLIYSPETPVINAPRSKTKSQTRILLNSDDAPVVLL